MRFMFLAVTWFPDNQMTASHPRTMPFRLINHADFDLVEPDGVGLASSRYRRTLTTETSHAFRNRPP
jgi:hypothetical protein